MTEYSFIHIYIAKFTSTKHMNTFLKNTCYIPVGCFFLYTNANDLQLYIHFIKCE